MSRRPPKTTKSAKRSKGAHRHGRSSPPEVEIIYGRHPVLAALRNPSRVHRTLILTPEGRELLKQSFSSEVTALIAMATITSRFELDRMAPPGATHQGLLLETEPLPAPHIDDLCVGNAGD